MIRRLLIAVLTAVVTATSITAAPMPADSTAAAAADTFDTLWPDSIPVLEGVDWSLVTGAATDSLLMSGMGVVIAFEDTFAFDPGAVDSIMVSAPRVTVAEVIEAVGRRMEQEERRLRDVEYTSLYTVVERDEPGRTGGDYKVTETAERTRISDDLGLQTVRLWRRERTVKDGEVTDEDVDEKTETQWEDMESAMMMAMPFAPGTANRYHYDITAVDLVGNDLVYRIDFSPKSRFEALPSGTVWVDYSHWSIRKLEARMTDVVPFPMFVEGIPVFRMSRERFGEYWFTTDMAMEIDLKAVPFVGNPRVIEVRMQLQDVVINGRPRGPESLVPRRLRHGNLDPEQFWMTEDASDDSLKAYWDGIAGVWDAELSPELEPVSLSPERVDTLTALGSRVLADLQTASPWTFGPRWAITPGYNRVQGPVVRLGARLKHRGPVRPRLDLTAGYGFANGRPEFAADLRLPLVRGQVSGWPGSGRRDRGIVELEARGWKDARLFAGDDRRHTRSASAFFYGSDPNQYFESRGASARLVLRPGGGLRAWGEAAYAEERALHQSTDWNVLGRRLRPDGNLAAVNLDDRRLAVGLAWTGGPLAVDGAATWHDADALGELSGRATLDLLDGLGNQWVVQGAARAFDGQAPRQWKPWLGDYGTLRGYPAAELGGDGAAWASLDLRINLDLLQALRLPVVGGWNLQPLAFADWGRTWHESGPLPAEGAAGERMDVGFGFGSRLQLPFAWQHPYVRCYAAKPVGEGSDGRGWRVLVAFEK
jgi:hypothetical protein